SELDVGGPVFEADVGPCPSPVWGWRPASCGALSEPDVGTPAQARRDGWAEAEPDAGVQRLTQRGSPVP
ncbi:uncharacterized protein SAZU_7901, partial [Streptomyces azureus]